MLDMTGKIVYLWDKLKVSIWFVPVLMSLGALILAVVMLEIDVRFGTIPWQWAKLLRIDSEGVRQVTGVISGAMMTITGVVFSVSVVTLALASNQFGPKVLRNYLHNTGNKFVLGLFVATFIYALLILASVDTVQGGFVPIWSVAVSILLTVLATGGLIYYIHNISTAIQADHIIALIGEELNLAIDNMLTPFDQSAKPESLNHANVWRQRTQNLKSFPLYSSTIGYIETIDYDAIVELASQQNIFIKLDIRVGHFAIEGSLMGNCYADQLISTDTITEIRSRILYGRQRTPVQDIEFPIAQLLQIALRALSPGINDSLTGMTCIDWLSSSLGRMSHCSFPLRYLSDSDGVVRLAKDSIDFNSVTNAIFDPLRQNSRGNEMVTIRLLEALERVIAVAENAEYGSVLLTQAAQIHQGANESIPNEEDRAVVSERFARCETAFENNIKQYQV